MFCFTAVEPNEKRQISILTKATKAPNAPCKVVATNPNGKLMDLPTKKTKDGFEATFAPLETGPHSIRIDFDNKQVPKSPFAVNVEPGCDLSKVEIKGLEKRE